MKSLTGIQRFWAVFFYLLLVTTPFAARAGNGTAQSSATTAAPATTNGTQSIARPEADVFPAWKSIDDGLEYFVEELSDDEDDTFVLVRVEPEKYVFRLHMASEEGTAMPLGQWADRHRLAAAINASMYLQDNRTSIGHMQSSTHVNNQRIGGRLGAFFLAEPAAKEDNKFPLADIVERGDDGWDELPSRYAIRVQNFRMMSRDGAILWNSDSREYSIAAIAKDRKGRILFALCQRPMTGADFARRLREYALDLSTVMYVEGGEKAALYVRDGKTAHQWVGRKSVLNIRGNPATAVPNIIGVSRR